MEKSNGIGRSDIWATEQNNCNVKNRHHAAPATFTKAKISRKVFPLKLECLLYSNRNKTITVAAKAKRKKKAKKKKNSMNQPTIER